MKIQVSRTLCSYKGYDLVIEYDNSFPFHHEGKPFQYDFRVYYEIDDCRAWFPNQRSAYKECDKQKAIDDFIIIIDTKFAEEEAEKVKAFHCFRCNQKHTRIEANTNYNQPFSNSICPVTHGPTDLTFRDGMKETAFLIYSKTFNNNIVHFKEYNVFMGSLFNNGINNKCIVFNDKYDYVIIPYDEPLVKGSVENYEVSIILKDTLETFEVFKTGKTYFGEENPSTYLITDALTKYEMQDLMKIHFNTHLIKPSLEKFNEALKLLGHDIK